MSDEEIRHQAQECVQHIHERRKVYADFIRKSTATQLDPRAVLLVTFEFRQSQGPALVDVVCIPFHEV